MDQNEEKIRRIGAAIAQLRVEEGLSQAALVRMVGHVSHSHMSRIENGHKVPSIPLLYRIADALEVDITYFFTKL